MSDPILFSLEPDSPSYPELWRQRLTKLAPQVVNVFGPLPKHWKGFAVVGSRETTDDRLAEARRAGQLAAESGLLLISGGARGVDQEAMLGCTEAGGHAVGIPAGRLMQTAHSTAFKKSLENGQLTLLSPYHPNAGFTVGLAMARNKLIYALAERTLVISSGDGKGGTWHGAVEALKRGFGEPCVLHSSLTDATLAKLADLGATVLVSLERILDPKVLGGLFSTDP